MLKKISLIILIAFFLRPGPTLAQTRIVKETPLAQVRFSPLTKKTLTVSPDSRRIAYIERGMEKEYVVVDGKDQKRFDAIMERPVFSPDGTRIAYIAREGGRACVVVDGKEDKFYDAIVGDPVFSPNSKKSAYVARNGSNELVVVDGAEQGSYDEVGRTAIRKGKVIFSPDSGSIAYVARSGQRSFVVVDGKKQKDYEIVGCNALWRWDIPVFSPDSRRVAYPARIGSKWHAVIDGSEDRQGYDSVSSIIFSPDDGRVAYLATEGKNDFAVVDGIRGREYPGIDLLTFSPDGKSLAYRAYRRGRVFGGDWYFILNGKEVKQFPILGDSFLSYGNLVFSPDSTKVAYKARFGIVVNDRAEKAYQKTGYPVFSPDATKLAYMAEEKGGQFLVINGKEGKKYDPLGSRFFLANPVFSPDSHRIAYAARIGKKWSVIVNDSEGRLYDEILVFPGGEKAFESFDNHPYYSGFKDKIETETALRGRIIFDAPERLHYLALRGDTVYLVEETIR